MAAAAAQAGTIDLAGLPGNFDQSSFGAIGSEFYAQSVLADAPVWADLQLGITDAEGGTFDLEIYDGRAAGSPGTGFAPDAGALLFDQTLTHTGGGLQTFDLSLNLTVSPGNTYVFVLNSLGRTLEGASVRATQFNGTDKYADGEFIYSNDDVALSNSTAWSSRFGNGEDLAFARPSPGP